MYLNLLIGIVGLATFLHQQPVNAKSDKELLQGVWKVTSVKGFAKEATREEMDQLKLTIRDNTLVAQYGDKTAKATFTLDQTKVPQVIDVKLTEGPEEVKNRTFHGIYLVEGDTLKVAYREPGQARPTAFVAPDETGVYKVEFKRVKSAEK